MMNSNNNLSFFINNSNDNSSNNYYLVSTNSFELNTGTSLSDDSGIPQTTNSSISSGSSGGKLCKFEFELAESDCEVSQFDSLENCSDGGMSAENFNTLKKGPLAPIEPPPEFQDSPQTTLMRSQFIQNYSNKITKTILTGAVEEYTDLPFKTKLLIQEINLINDLENEDNDFEDEESFFNVNANNNSNELLYDNNDSDNIYDEPTHEYDNNISSSSLTNVKANLMLSKKKLLKMVHSSTGGSSKSEIYNYDNSFKRILTPVDSFKRRSSSSCCSKTPNSILYSPLHNHHHHLNLNLNHHTGSSNLSTITNRPHSRNSLNSRLSSSHNSLSVPTANKADDSIFITQAMSHDALLGHDISDFYNVPLDSDMYALPIDVIKTSSQILTTTSEANKITSTSVSNILDIKYTNKSQRSKLKYIRNTKKRKRAEKNAAAANVPEPSSSTATFEPMHMTLDEVKRYYHTLYSSSSDSSAAVGLNNTNSKHNRKTISNNNNKTLTSNKSDKLKTMNLKTSAVNTHKSNNKKLSNATKDECANNNFNSNNSNNNLNMNHQNIKYGNISKKSQFSINLKQKFCSIFRFRKSSSLSVASSSAASTSGTATVTTTTTSAAVATTSANHNHSNHNNNNNSNINNNNNNIHLNHHQKEQQTKLMQQDLHEYSTNNTNRLNSNLSINTDSDKMNYDKNVKLSTRALPPLPGSTPTETDQFVTNHQRLESSSFSALPDNRSISSIDVLDDEKFYERESTMDFATNIEKVKDFGWYWGPISSDGAEKILSNEPDGSFIVRDSSDDHFIFSLTFKLNGCVRHVRIDQDQGTFSFGSCAKFKSRTIMEFIENAVEHSRSGRYLFFLHRRPEHGPMRVQLTNPVSRFKHIQSLQHMCRFVILKTVVRKDLIQSLPLPRRLLDYLGHKNCLAEQCPIDSDSSSQSQVYGENNVNPT